MNRHGTPTKPNKTTKATAADTVMTPVDTAKFIIDHFKPTGTILDPCAGNNAFYDNYPEHCTKYRCEITENIDFLDWQMKVDWLISNPPYSVYDLFLEHAFEIADNVVWFCPIAKAFKSNKVQKMVMEYGGLKEIVYMGGGGKHGFAFGFPVGCLHYQRGWEGDCRITNNI